jgi:hypothetical protein
MSSFGANYLKIWEIGTGGTALSFAHATDGVTVTGSRTLVQSELNSMYDDLDDGADFFKEQVENMLEIIKGADQATDKVDATNSVYVDAADLPLWGLLKSQTPLFVAYCDEIMGEFKTAHSTTANNETLLGTDATTTVSEWRDIFEACEECSTCAPLMDSDCGTPEPWKCKDKFFCVKQMWTYIAAGCLVAVVILMLMMTMK